MNKFSVGTVEFVHEQIVLTVEFSKNFSRTDISRLTRVPATT